MGIRKLSSARAQTKFLSPPPNEPKLQAISKSKSTENAKRILVENPKAEPRIR